jgi:uncharacterized YccA/Bax inhibitor family protein
MSSRNPVLRNIKAPVVSDEELARIVNGGQLAGQATLADVITNTAKIFGLVTIGAAYGWITAETNPTLALIAFGVAFVLSLVNAFKKQVSPALVLLYGAAEGVALGAISRFVDQAYGPGIAQQAVVGTMAVFAIMLVLYQSKIIKVNGRFMKMFTIAMFSYLAIAIGSLIAAMFGVGQGWGFYGVGQLGLLLCLFGVGLAAFSLVMDFEVITQAVAQGIPQRESWRLAFGLTVSLVWLYTELLRLLAILNRD